MYPLAYWKHDLDPVLWQITDSLAIRWYGVAYLLGFLAAGVLLHFYYRRGRSPLNLDQQSMAMTALIVGVLLGGRVGYLILYQPEQWLRDPLLLFKIWQGGMASHGGFIGVGFAMLWIARKTKTSFWALGDIVVTLAPAGLFFGRIANFINGELWGRPTEAPWAVVFRKGIGGTYGLPRHPSQLYEAALEGLVLGIYLQLRFWLRDTHTAKRGQLVGECLLVYAVLRIIGEVFREPDAELILGMSRGIFYSLFFALAGLLIMFRPVPQNGAFED